MLIVAGYADVDLAEREFRALADRVAAEELISGGMLPVGQNVDGTPRLMDTGNACTADGLDPPAATPRGDGGRHDRRLRHR